MDNINNDLEETDEKKDIEIISGDVTDLDISKVYDHLNVEKPVDENSNKKNIVIPSTSKDNTEKK